LEFLLSELFCIAFQSVALRLPLLIFFPLLPDFQLTLGKGELGPFFFGEKFWL
jgi:hypothetical protein